MNQREKDFNEGVHRYGYESPKADGFADGAEYARTKFAHRLRMALEFQCKIDRGFEPSTTEVLEELIAELEKDA